MTALWRAATASRAETLADEVGLDPARDLLGVSLGPDFENEGALFASGSLPAPESSS
jgi:hypothetical protein